MSVSPFKPGSYIIEEAYVVVHDADGGKAVVLTDGVLDVEKDPLDNEIVNGRAFVHNLSMVNLLEEHEKLDILLKMGEGFCFRLTEPIIQGGKVFEKTTRSILRFTPTSDFEQLSDEEFAQIKKTLEIF
ncbi:MAG: hypothetical protein JRI45_04990 [Deltaproteobacteria bacterium]|nr:hypothetical protein [Deltaproteobacteria bacterium]MBW2067903.1 hypothetical protein [Deltaproteobacteria bacterium]